MMGISLATYAVALTATLPAGFVLPAGDRWQFAGTIWSGEAVLDGGHRLEWHWAPLRSLANLAFAADWRLTGDGTDVAGGGVMRDGGVTLTDITGQAGAALLSALAPHLPFACKAAVQVDLAVAAIGGSGQRVNGTLRSGAATCTVRGVASVKMPVPPLVLIMRRNGPGSEGWIAPADGALRKLVNVTLSSHGRLDMRVTRAGGEVLPFARGRVLTTKL